VGFSVQLHFITKALELLAGSFAEGHDAQRVNLLLTTCIFLCSEL
jgi:hypothetical protein